MSELVSTASFEKPGFVSYGNAGGKVSGRLTITKDYLDPSLGSRIVSRIASTWPRTPLAII